MTTTPGSPLAGHTAIVTGAAQGLGYAIARAYAEHGMNVVLMDVQAERLAEVVAALKRFSGQCIGVPADLSDATATTEAVQAALDHFGTPRILVHNAAILRMRAFAELDFAEWQRTVNVGLQAAYLLTKPVWLRMVAAGGGQIVYVSSRSGIEGFADESAYCAAKHGLEGLMKSLALEGAAYNIGVNTITPGMYMHTPMSEQNYDEAARQKWVDPYLLTPAFVRLAQRDLAIPSGARLNAWELSQPPTPAL